MSKRIIISASSDIGLALGHHWLSQGHEVLGTYRTWTEALDELERAGAKLAYCDVDHDASVKQACAQLLTLGNGWETLVIAAGLQDPVGPFLECDFHEWERSVRVNFVGQMRIIHALAPGRDKGCPMGPIVLLFAGGGTNSATPNYSAYTVSKIGLIKTCELLDAEITDLRITILGPGWVKTKFHSSTLNAKERSGANYQRALQKLASDECTPIEKVVECCDWLVGSPRDVIGGRNFSLVYDCWGSEELNSLLRRDPNMYKLRRRGNDDLVRSKPITERVGSGRRP